MKYIVFGATGYLGKHVARYLAASGHEVTGFVRNESGAAAVREMSLTPLVGDLDDGPCRVGVRPHRG